MQQDRGPLTVPTLGGRVHVCHPQLLTVDIEGQELHRIGVGIFIQGNAQGRCMDRRLLLPAP
jgi:hypothetical protein